MTPTRSEPKPRTVFPPVAPARAPQPATRQPAPAPLPVPTTAPDWPSRWHLLIPANLRNQMAALGLWQNPTPPRAHWLRADRRRHRTRPLTERDPLLSLLLSRIRPSENAPQHPGNAT